MLILINQTINKLNLKDNNINLNVLKFLNSIAEDFSMLLLDKSILIFQKLKVVNVVYILTHKFYSYYNV